MPVHVAVVIHGGERPLDRVFAVVDRGTHGRAALDLALRVALRKKSGLHAVLVPEDGSAEDTELLELIRDAGRALGRRLHTDVLSAPTAAQLARQTPGGLVIVATNLADRVGLSPEDFTDPNDASWWCKAQKPPPPDSAPARLSIIETPSRNHRPIHFVKAPREF